MAAADHETVGAVGFAAWAASDAFEDSYLDPDVIARVWHEFAIFPEETKGEIFVAERDETIVGWARVKINRTMCPTSGCIPITRATASAGLSCFICAS